MDRRKMHVEKLKNRARFQAEEMPDWSDTSRRQSRHALEDMGEVQRTASIAEVVTIFLLAAAWIGMLFIWIYAR